MTAVASAPRLRRSTHVGYALVSIGAAAFGVYRPTIPGISGG